MIMRIKTTDNREYTLPVVSKLKAAKTLLTLRQVGILAKWWRYEDENGGRA